MASWCGGEGLQPHATWPPWAIGGTSMNVAVHVAEVTGGVARHESYAPARRLRAGALACLCLAPSPGGLRAGGRPWRGGP
eukprot:scaffold159657_cov33-Tisochrysis_lutea.AAC.1